MGWVALSYPLWVVLYWASWSSHSMVGVMAGRYDGAIATLAVYTLLVALSISLLAAVVYVLLRLMDLGMWFYARRGSRS
jgi:hypothetical protein